MDLGIKWVLEGFILHQCYQSQVSSSSSFGAISKRMKSQMLRNDDDLAYIENRMSRYRSPYMPATSQKISGRYLLNSGLCTTYGRLYTSTHFSTVLLYLLYWIIDPI